MEVGQKYSFDIEGSHPNPHFIICKIDKDYGKEIVSIYIGGLKFKNPSSPSGFGETINHVPVDIESLKSAKIELISDNVAIPDYVEGYNSWREVFESGEGGYFTIPPERIVEYIMGVIAN